MLILFILGTTTTSTTTTTDRFNFRRRLPQPDFSSQFDTRTSSPMPQFLPALAVQPTAEPITTTSDADIVETTVKMLLDQPTTILEAITTSELPPPTTLENTNIEKISLSEDDQIVANDSKLINSVTEATNKNLDVFTEGNKNKTFSTNKTISTWNKEKSNLPTITSTESSSHDEGDYKISATDYSLDRPGRVKEKYFKSFANCLTKNSF